MSYCAAILDAYCSYLTVHLFKAHLFS